MKTWILTALTLVACTPQQPDSYYFTPNQTQIVAKLRKLFNKDFQWACTGEGSGEIPKLFRGMRLEDYDSPEASLDAMLKRTLKERDRLRAKLLLSPEQVDNLPEELRCLTTKTWGCRSPMRSVEKYGISCDPILVSAE